MKKKNEKEGCPGEFDWEKIEARIIKAHEEREALRLKLDGSIWEIRR